MVKSRMADGRRNLIAERLVELRLKNRLSQRALARRLWRLGVKMDKSTIARIETNKRHVTDIELRALALVLGVRFVCLLRTPPVYGRGGRP